MLMLRNPFGNPEDHRQVHRFVPSNRLGLAKPKRDMMYAWGGFALVMLNGGRSRLALGVPNVAAILCLSLPLAKDGSRLGLGLAKPKLDMMSFPNVTWFFHDGHVWLV
ncbi:hypothetical protein PIB30_079564 [Stylosanthes scabra]|uniref:Uncharacterized protein n=1 Tax=Stylosanthes scabra TaxID=79078 RepID=A0ABU6UQ07_9FABA|nr:hypothetical protein [Stylosanthes scabra]